mmetsp:Transcript_65540/g.188974  ORF Transcript_65540/g.188974 Transcript_65540/m.188974 type:complete len:209 (+) Transcript_65540:3-629(+)
MRRGPTMSRCRPRRTSTMGIRPPQRQGAGGTCQDASTLEARWYAPTRWAGWCACAAHGKLGWTRRPGTHRSSSNPHPNRWAACLGSSRAMCPVAACGRLQRSSPSASRPSLTLGGTQCADASVAPRLRANRCETTTSSRWRSPDLDFAGRSGSRRRPRAPADPLANSTKISALRRSPGSHGETSPARPTLCAHGKQHQRHPARELVEP